KRDLAQVASTSKTLYTSSLEAASHLECSQTHAFINALLTWGRQIKTLPDSTLEALESLNRSLSSEFHVKSWSELRSLQPKILDQIIAIFIKDLSDELLQLLIDHLNTQSPAADFKYYTEILSTYRTIKREIAAPNPNVYESDYNFNQRKLRTFFTFSQFCCERGLFQTSLDVALCFSEKSQNLALASALKSYLDTLCDFFKNKPLSPSSSNAQQWLRCVDACIKISYKMNRTHITLQKIYSTLCQFDKTENEKKITSQAASLTKKESKLTILHEGATKIISHSLESTPPSSLDHYFLKDVIITLAKWGYCDKAHQHLSELKQEYRWGCMPSLIHANIRSRRFERAIAYIEQLEDTYERKHYWKALITECVKADDFERAHQLLKQIDSQTEQDECLALIAQGYARKKDFTQAFHYANIIESYHSRSCFSEIFEMLFEQNRFREALTFALEIKNPTSQKNFLRTVLLTAVKLPTDSDSLYLLSDTERPLETKQDLDAIREFAKNISDEHWLLLVKSMLTFVECMTSFNKKAPSFSYKRNYFDLETQDKILFIFALLWKKMPDCNGSELASPQESQQVEIQTYKRQMENLFDLFWEKENHDAAFNIADFLSIQKDLRGTEGFFCRVAELAFECGRSGDGLRYFAHMKPYRKDKIIQTHIERLIEKEEYANAISFSQNLSYDNKWMLQEIFKPLFKRGKFDLIFALAPLCPKPTQDALLQEAIIKLTNRHQSMTAWTYIQSVSDETEKKQLSINLLKNLETELDYLDLSQKSVLAEIRQVIGLILETYSDLRPQRSLSSTSASSSSSSSSSSGPIKPLATAFFPNHQNWISQQLRSQNYSEIANHLMLIEDQKILSNLLTCMFDLKPEHENWLNHHGIDYVKLTEEQSKNMLHAIEALPASDRKNALLLMMDPAYPIRKDQLEMTQFLSSKNYDGAAQHLLTITNPHLRIQLLNNIYQLTPERVSSLKR
ncbi:MAG: hypothetical protein K2W97_08610, partial [Chthoniobacterales bacterium]|nr:hypothetical protein [Chthoniobacterales bacterium]